MARHGENIRKRRDGRWEGRYKAYSERKGRHIYRSVYAGTYAQVKEKLTAAKLTLQKNLGSGGGGTCSSFQGGMTPEAARAAASGILLSDAAMAWLKNKEKQCKYSTYIKYEAVYRVHLSAFFSCHSLTGAESGVLSSEISDHLSDEVFSESLSKSICCVANQIFRHVNDTYGLHIPFLKQPSFRSKRKPMETFTGRERQRLFSSIYKAPNKYGAAVLLCLHTGLRIGELCALRWEDVNLREMTLNVERTVQRIAVRNQATENQTAREQAVRTAAKTVLMETEPKSENSRRTIPLTAEAVRLLAGLQGEETERTYIFGGDRPLEPRTMQYRFRKMLTAAGVEVRNFHMLRHTFATSCIESGMDVKSLSEILGHSDITITMNRYVHPTMDSKRKQMRTLSAFYGRICGQEERKTA